MVISGNGETLPGRTTSGSRKAETCLIHGQSRLDGGGRLVFVLGAWSVLFLADSQSMYEVRSMYVRIRNLEANRAKEEPGPKIELHHFPPKMLSLSVISIPALSRQANKKYVHAYLGR